jgi:hypothetical protein
MTTSYHVLFQKELNTFTRENMMTGATLRTLAVKIRESP